jgi:hypothetical protein
MTDSWLKDGRPSAHELTISSVAPAASEAVERGKQWRRRLMARQWRRRSNPAASKVRELSATLHDRPQSEKLEGR